MKHRPFCGVRLLLFILITLCASACTPMQPPSPSTSSSGPRSTFTYEETGIGSFTAHSVEEVRKAADQGVVLAQVMLGRAYYNGRWEWGVPQDYTEAAKWYRQAADRGSITAQETLGDMYSEGKGVPQDYTEAAKWYGKAADRGALGAQVTLGDMYYEGKGVPQDYTEAVKWYRKAANRDGIANFNLGRMYRDGKGVPKDAVQAYNFFTVAVAKVPIGEPRYEEAVKARDALAARLTAAQRAEIQNPSLEAQQHYKVATVALKNNDLEVAAEELNQAAKASPGNALILFSLATVQSKLERVEVAMENLKRAKQFGLPPEQREAAEELEINLTYQMKKLCVSDINQCPVITGACICNDGTEINMAAQGSTRKMAGKCCLTQLTKEDCNGGRGPNKCEDHGGVRSVVNK